MLSPTKLQPHLLTIVNCNRFHGEQDGYGAYACPTTGSAGTFKNGLYMGLCWGRSVQRVAEVQAVVAVHPVTKQAKILSNNVGADILSDTHLMEEAKKYLRSMFPAAKDEHMVFILGKRSQTDFRNSSTEPMQYRKTYRNISSVRAADAQELAHLLDGRTWDEFPRN